MSADVPPPGAPGQQFKCGNCGGEMAYDAAARALKCGFCGSLTAAAPTGSAPAQAANVALATVPREIPLRDGLARAPKGLGAALQTVQCRECGATVNLAPNDRTARCTYCASSQVLAVPPDPNLITPESLVPFLVPRERATQQFQGWLKGLWFRPNDLSRMARLEQIVGVYVPYWTFDADVHSDWHAERGWYYYETEQYTEVENGQQVTRTRQVQRVRWERASGWREDHHDDVLVCASRGLPTKLVDRFATFDTRALVTYAPGYLAGWRAESYGIDLMGGWQHAIAHIENEQRRRCAGDVGGDTHQGLNVTNRFANETFKHVLLPIFIAAYRYNDKPYRFLVNGQSGEVVGEAPLSVWKIVLLIALIVAIAIGAFVAYTTLHGDVGVRDGVTQRAVASHTIDKRAERLCDAATTTSRRECRHREVASGIASSTRNRPEWPRGLGSGLGLLSVYFGLEQNRV